MGEIGVKEKGRENSPPRQQVFYASGVDKLARFVDEHSTEIRVSLYIRRSCFSILVNVQSYYRSPLLEGRD